jgi:ABC-type antimicrobial peptide transport system permease subunit
MKASMYTTYPARSLARGGQRTLLALFCVAVGVMAIVGLQLVGGMIGDALIGNARAINGGDLSVRVVTPLAERDLAPFAELKNAGVLTLYTAAFEDGVQLPRPGGGRINLQVAAVDPAVFPLTGQPALDRPAGGDFRATLGEPGAAVASRSLFDALGGELGKTVRVTAGLDSRSFDARLVGVLDERETLGQGDALYVSLETLRRASDQPLAYTTVYATTPDAARAASAEEQLAGRLIGARVQTADGLLKQLEENVELINRFLVIVGLLALLIGGVGIVNTMQVLLARRKIEIAMLKTTGYQRRDLYLLFGLEAALLGLIGGVLGALAGIGVAFGIRGLFERAFRLVLTFTLDPGVILGGVAVGLATALIFGLLPIVRAAGVRPQAVIRELPEGQGWRTALGSVGLILLLAVLFAALASAIIGSPLWGLAAVGGAFAALALLSLAFGLLVFAIGRLPVPERYSLPFLLLVTAGVAGAAALTFFVPDLRGVGILLLAATLLGYVVVLLPRAWKINTKMAFRNLGRARGRTVTTLLALFIGVFAVGLVLVLGSGIRETINGFIAQQVRYNIIALAQRADRPALDRALDGVAGDVRARQVVEVAPGTVPLDINGTPLTTLLAGADQSARNGPPPEVFVRNLSGLQGYDLAAGQRPTVGTPPEELDGGGRNLGAGDAGTTNVIVDESLRNAPTNMKLGDTFTSLNQFTGGRQTLTVVGFYKATGTGVSINLNVAPVFGSLEATRALGGPATQAVYYLQVEPRRTGAVTDALTEAAPRAQAVNLGDLVGQFNQVLNNLLLMLTAIASLALVAGVVIIANAVALAMLERRRELGIMKSVGYTSRRVLGVVLIENGLIGGLGGLLGMLLVALATAVFNRQAGLSLGVDVGTTLGLIALVAAVAMLTATLVAWGATRVRPLEVLRYE